MRRLPRSFYKRDVHVVAKELLNKVIVKGSTSARILEVEAYSGNIDPASHAYRGPTPRNEVMFGEGGFLYVYFTYGMHFCMNVVTGTSGEAHAVLIRAAEPLTGLPTMRNRRGAKISDRDLCRGPARLTQALGVDRKLNGIDLCKPAIALSIFDDGVAAPKRIERGPRIGIKNAVELPWRYWVDSPYVSR